MTCPFFWSTDWLINWAIDWYMGTGRTVIWHGHLSDWWVNCSIDWLIFFFSRSDYAAGGGARLCPRLHQSPRAGQSGNEGPRRTWNWSHVHNAHKCATKLERFERGRHVGCKLHSWWGYDRLLQSHQGTRLSLLPFLPPSAPPPSPRRLFISTSHLLVLIKRARTRVVVVVVVVRKLFLVTSVICVRIRGRGSEVTTTPYHFRSDFRL